MDQINRGNISEVKGKNVRDSGKELHFVLRGTKVENALNDVKYLITEIQTGEPEILYIDESNFDNEMNRWIEFKLERRNDPKLKNIPAFIAIMEPGNTLSQVPDTTDDVESTRIERVPDDR